MSAGRAQGNSSPEPDRRITWAGSHDDDRPTRWRVVTLYVIMIILGLAFAPVFMSPLRPLMWTWVALVALAGGFALFHWLDPAYRDQTLSALGWGGACLICLGGSLAMVGAIGLLWTVLGLAVVGGGLALCVWLSEKYTPEQAKAVAQAAGVACILVLASSFSRGKSDTSDALRQSIDYQRVAENHLQRILRDPSSLEVIEWGPHYARPGIEGSFMTVTYRARNGFGGMNMETRKFHFSPGGSVVSLE